jgi:hypothetical protein
MGLFRSEWSCERLLPTTTIAWVSQTKLPRKVVNSSNLHSIFNSGVRMSVGEFTSLLESDSELIVCCELDQLPESPTIVDCLVPSCKFLPL